MIRCTTYNFAEKNKLTNFDDMIHAQFAVADILCVEWHNFWNVGFMAPAQICPVSLVVKLLKKPIE